MKQIANQMKELIKIQLQDDNTITSVDLVEIINTFRAMEEKTELQHCDFIKKIRKEIEVLKGLGIGQGNFSESYYINIQGKKQPCFKLNRDGMLEMLNSESILVRHKTIEYINKLEKQVLNLPKLSSMDLLKLQVKALEENTQAIVEVKEDVKDLRENSPLYNVECDELQKIVKAKGTKVLGGRNSIAYKNKSIRAKVYSDIQREIKRQFSVRSYKAIRRKDLSIAKEIVKVYKLPFILSNEISEVNELDSYELNEM